MIFYKNSKYAIVPLSLLLAQSADARCASGVPDANQVLMDTINEPDALAWVNELMDPDYEWTWTSERGAGDLVATDLEYSKFFLGAYLLGNGVVNDELQVSQGPSGSWEYPPNQIYFTPAFHRSWDEWAPLISDTGYTVCDSLSASDGTFGCEKERYRNWPARKHYRWFGYPSITTIFDSYLDMGLSLNEDVDPDTEETVVGRVKPLKKLRGLAYLCPMFEDDRGNFDQMVLPRVIFNLALSSWYLHLDRRPKGDRTNKTFVVSPTHSHRREAIGRTDSDDEVSKFQVAHEAMCDLTLATQSWVPLMVNEVMSEGFRDEARKPRYDNTKGGKVGFTCTSMRDALVDMIPTPPASCGTGGASCIDDSDCPSGFDYCSSTGCCGILR
jgi:hypothetical protein